MSHARAWDPAAIGFVFHDAKCDRQGRLWVDVMHERMTEGAGSPTRYGA